MPKLRNCSKGDSNPGSLDCVSEQQPMTMETLVPKRKLSYSGQVIKSKEHVGKDLTPGITQYTRRRERQQRMREDTSSTGVAIVGLTEIVLDRTIWKKIMLEFTITPSTLGLLPGISVYTGTKWRAKLRYYNFARSILVLQFEVDQALHLTRANLAQHFT